MEQREDTSEIYCFKIIFKITVDKIQGGGNSKQNRQKLNIKRKLLSILAKLAVMLGMSRILSKKVFLEVFSKY